MQPPTFIRSPLRTHLTHLKQAAQRGGTYTQPARQSDRLRERLNAWLQNMTTEQRCRRFTIEEVERLAGLVGKHGGQAAHHHIAQALRSVGFTPCRDWTVAGRNRRYWQLPGEPK